MPNLVYRSSRSDQWTSPRPYRDASLRHRAHGPIQPMLHPKQGFFAQFFGQSSPA